MSSADSNLLLLSRWIRCVWGMLSCPPHVLSAAAPVHYTKKCVKPLLFHQNNTVTSSFHSLGLSKGIQRTHPSRFLFLFSFFFKLCLGSPVRKKQQESWNNLFRNHLKQAGILGCRSQVYNTNLSSSIILSFSSIFLSLSSASFFSFRILSFSQRRLSSTARRRSFSFLSSSSRFDTWY